MNKPIIEVKSLSKKYTLGERQPYYSFRDTISGVFHTPFKKEKLEKDEFWALKDVSFDIYQSDVVGVIGRNGAGKSTLLKILSQITPPTEGEVKLRGRVASLLEVGTGFHPELTGRENIYLNGAILGMKRWEINKKFKEIVDFSEIEKFLDTPVKHYSSGMYMRLAFSVAAHLEPEILIIDEVLAVGDAQFQKKCLGKMSEVSKQGRTVIFVSHNMSAVEHLCEKAIFLENGMVKTIGPVKQIIDIYNKNVVESKNGIWINKKQNNEAFIDQISICDVNDIQKNSFIRSEKIKIKIKLNTLTSIKRLKVGFDLLKDDEVVFRAEQVDGKLIDNFDSDKSYEFICTIPNNFLNVGNYLIRPLLSIHCEKSLMPYYPVMSFSIDIDKGRNSFHEILNEDNHPGLVFPDLKWQIK